tara:strand:+ start:3157 stop:4227 length:1071 start_codon:yes stop_codon:yes gene_type:complete
MISKSLLKKYSWIDNIFRVRGPLNTRFNKLRLDKNERVSNLEKNFFNLIKKKLKHEHFTTYPETENLYNLLAKKLKISKNSLVLTAGADGALRLCFDLFVKPKDKVITLSPTFAMVDIYVKLFKSRQIKIKYNKNLELNYDKLLRSIKSNVSLLIFANPNSPTGTILNNQQILKILKKAKQKGVIVVIDEAYEGFSEYTALPLIKKFSNLIITRTFSKSFGLAGCRAGYLVSQPYLATKLFKFKPMYEINSIAALTVFELLKNDKLIKKYLKDTKQGKQYLIKKLKLLNYNFLKSYANFIHINFKNKKKIAEKLFEKENILVKGGPGVAGFEKYLRITLGPIKQMNKVVKILNKIR